MSIQVWTLSPLGNAMASSTKAPKTLAWAVIYHLKRVGSATSDQILAFTGADGHILQKLRSKGIVTELTRTEV